MDDGGSMIQNILPQGRALLSDGEFVLSKFDFVGVWGEPSIGVGIVPENEDDWMINVSKIFSSN